MLTIRWARLGGTDRVKAPTPSGGERAGWLCANWPTLAAIAPAASDNELAAGLIQGRMWGATQQEVNSQGQDRGH